jgi:ATP-dependent Clp protease adapter protein ClpS
MRRKVEMGMPKTGSVTVTRTSEGTGNSAGAMAQVVLHNDNHNEAAYVVACLVRVFKHSEALATKIMAEAHNRGRAIAEVEPEPDARKHCEQLKECGLGATIETV